MKKLLLAVTMTLALGKALAAEPRPDSKTGNQPQGVETTLAAARAACEEQKRAYRESERCFAPYRTANGGIKAEAFQKCKEVKEPQC
jgi:hypothetical protein